MRKVPTVPIYGIPVSTMNMKDTVAYLTDSIKNRVPHQIITANPIMVMTALENPAYMDLMRKAELVVPDGTGLVWAAGYVGTPVSERVAGFDLMHNLFQVGEDYGWKVYFIGAAPEIIQITAERIHAKYPKLRIVGVKDGFFGADQDEEVLADIERTAPDMQFVGRSVSTQEPWIAKYKERLRIPVMMGVGGSFDVIAGKVKRAPLWMQKMKLEWFFRLLQEPSRYRRMLVLPKFALKVLREKDKVRNL